MSKVPKKSIGRRITAVIALSTAVVTFVGIGLVYYFGSNLLMNTLSREHSQIAKALGAYIIKALDGEVEDARSYATRTLWKDCVRQSNARYESMDKDSIARYMEDMDKKWAFAQENDPLFKEYLESKISLGMRDTIKVRGKMAELFITDKYGGLAASSGKTSDFYQADEDWWKTAYNGGKGGTFVSDVEYDDSSRQWVVSIAVPIKDTGGEVIGVIKDSVNVEKIYENLENFKIGDTGHAALLDKKGNIIFHSNAAVMKERLFTEEGLNEIVLRQAPYIITNDGFLHSKNMFSTFTRVDSPYFSKTGVSWVVLVSQDEAEVKDPLNKFILGLIVISILMLILIIPVGYILGGLISRPIRELRAATEHIMAGDWDYTVKIKTGDEIEQFTDTFTLMTAGLKAKQDELESFSKSLEAKAEERTKELSTAQEATLNILEEMQKTKEDLETSNKELLKLDQLKSDFISTVSHELRTPLSIIKEGISLVLDRIPGDVNEKQAKILSISKYNIDRLARIIDSLLDMSKIEAGRVQLKKSLINILDVVKQTVASFESVIKDRGLELRLDVDKVIGSVYADPDRIAQIFTNLIGNALKFTPSGHIDISCKDKGDEVICSVADTGVGISKDDIPKVFSKFQQFRRMAGAGDMGTGLGLSIAKSIVDMHDGAIWVESEVGKGTKFTFKLHKYTPQSLFREYVARALNEAVNEKTRMSILAINLNIVGKDETLALKNKLHDIMRESAGIIKNALRHDGDDVVNGDSEMIVILADCDKEGAAKIQYRLEEIINKYLAGRKADGMIKVNYGYATYPDDAKSDLELIEKAKA